MNDLARMSTDTPAAPPGRNLRAGAKPVVSSDRQYKALTPASAPDRQWFLNGTYGLLHLLTLHYVDLDLLDQLLESHSSTQPAQLRAAIRSLKATPWWDQYKRIECLQAVSDAGIDAPPWATSHHALGSSAIGRLYCFCHHFRTKHVGCLGDGEDRHGLVYRKTREATLTLPTDPKWVVPGRGHSSLRRGQTILAGVFLVEAIDHLANQASGRPLVLGDPVWQYAVEMSGKHGYPVARERLDSGSCA